MKIINATRLVAPVPDSQYRLVPCKCGNNHPVYVMGNDRKWRVLCLDCQNETESFHIQHDAQLNWNKEMAQ